MEIYKKPRYVHARYDEVNDVIIFDWENFSMSLEDMKILHQKALDTATLKKCFYFIAESSKVRSALSQEVIKWWGNEWLPILVKAGLRAIVTVVPSSAIANLSTKSWQAEVVGGITMKNVKTFAEALTFIQSIRQ